MYKAKYAVSYLGPEWECYMRYMRSLTHIYISRASEDYSLNVKKTKPFIIVT